MKRVLVAALLLAALPFAACAQNLNGFYVGARGGANWLLNTSANINSSVTVLGRGTGRMSGPVALDFDTGWAAGGFVGYDFVGPRLEIETLYRDNKAMFTGTVPIAGVGNFTFLNTNTAEVQQTSVMANLYYDFFAKNAFTPYVGAGAGVAFVHTRLTRFGALTDSDDTEFAYQAIVGVAYKATRNVRISVDGRYYGTLNPTFNNSFNLPATVPVSGSGSGYYSNNNFAILASITYTFGPPAPTPP